MKEAKRTAPDGWRELSDSEGAELHSRIKKPLLLGGGLPRPSARFALNYAAEEQVREILLEGLRAIVRGGRKAYAVDIEHDYYQLTPGKMRRDQVSEWPVDVLGSGDDHVFVTSDLSSGTISRYETRALEVFGDLLGAVDQQRLEQLLR